MKINTKFLFILLNLINVTSFLFILYSKDFNIIQVLPTLFYLIFPGLLIFFAINSNILGLWEYFIYSFSLSLSLLIFGELLLNNFFLLLNVKHPLNNLYTSIYLFLEVLILSSLLLKKRFIQIFSMTRTKISIINVVFIIFAISFSIQTFLNSQFLNNSNNNILSISLIFQIVLYYLLIFIFKNKLNKNILYPLSILSVSFSLLLSLSMRSNHIVGWDINQELFVFNLTKKLQYWSIKPDYSAYNACLSITILPTVISYISKISNEYIFKFIYPLIFSFVPVSTYIISNKFVKKDLALLSALILIFQPQYLIEIVMLARQEIAFVFYATSLLVFFDQNLSIRIKKLLFIIFTFSLIVSHYSTSYVAIILYIFAYFCILFYKIIHRRLNEESTFFLNYRIIGVILIFALLWNIQLSPLKNNLKEYYLNTISNLNKIFKSELKSESARAAIWNSYFGYSQLDLYKYNNENIKIASKSKISLYPKVQYSNYLIKPVFFGIANNKYLKNLNFIGKIVASILKVFLCIGFIYIIFSKKFNNKVVYSYNVLSIVSLLLIFIFLIIPYLSLGYNFERLTLQILILTSLLIILGGYVLLNKLSIKNDFNEFIILILTLYYLIFSSNVLNAIFKADAPMQFSNSGIFYNRYYLHDSDIQSMSWLSNVYSFKYAIYADSYAKLKFQTFSNISNYGSINEIILPATIDKNAYIYLDYSNLINKVVLTKYKDNDFAYNYPYDFVQKNKNKVYSNGKSEIFK